MTSTFYLPLSAPRLCSARSHISTRARSFSRSFPADLFPRTVKNPQNTSVVCGSGDTHHVSWLLDTPGCCSHRTASGGFDQVSKDTAKTHCPPKPIDLEELCDESGSCVIGGALFVLEKESGKLFVQNANAKALDELEKREWFEKLQAEQERAMEVAKRTKHSTNPSMEYDSFIDMEDDCGHIVQLPDGDEICEVEESFDDDATRYEANVSTGLLDLIDEMDDVMDNDARDAPQRSSAFNSEIDQEDTDETQPIQAVRVDGLRLKPFGRVELKPGALVDIGDGVDNSHLSVYASATEVYVGVFELNRVARDVR